MKRYNVLLKQNDKKIHTKLIPLCVEHHRLSNVLSAHGTPKLWRETFSMLDQEIRANELHERFISETI